MTIEETIKARPMPLKTKTLINIMYTSRVVEEVMANLLKEYELSSQQFNVLRILRGQNGKPASLFTIQERMVDRNSNTTRLVDKLIKKELVARRICPHNRRKVEITITKKGEELLKALDPQTMQLNAEITGNLSDGELAQLNNLLDKLRKDENTLHQE